MTAFFRRRRFAPRPRLRAAFAAVLFAFVAQSSYAQERMYFPAVDNVRSVLVQRINAETVRIDMSAWYLTEGEIVNALLAKHAQGVPIRLLGDRGSIFEIDVHTRNAFYRLANAGVPIRLRVNPTWYPEIDHWKATIFVGQGIVTFGSANYTPFELAPHSATNYKDETVLFTDDPELLAAFKMKFDQFWNDTTAEPNSLVKNPPYFKNWADACAQESMCADWKVQYPNPAPMIINTERLEPDAPLPADMVWGQGPLFNNRLIDEIKKETTGIGFVIYRLTVPNITDALLAKHKSGVPIRIIIEPFEYRNKKWPEFWLTHAYIDKLWAAGVQIKKRAHTGLTHMKMLLTSNVATNASSNFAAAWQRDHNYFIPADRKPALYKAMRDRFEFMWGDTVGFTDFVPEPPDTPSLASPVKASTAIPTTTSLVWNRAAFATSYDVYLGTSDANMVKVANVPAVLNNNPPLTYSYTPPALQTQTTYYWRVDARTNASDVAPNTIVKSERWTFTTGGTVGPPSVPANPNPANSATNVSVTTQLTWAAGPTGTTYNVEFGTSNPPSQVATGLTSAVYSPSTLSPSTTYFWRVTSVNGAGSTTGPVWSFTTGSGAAASEIVLYASDVSNKVGAWTQVQDASAAGGALMRHPEGGYANTNNALANPAHYFEAQFQAQANTRYRVWVRMRALDDSKWNDSVFVQFSDSVTSGGAPIYRIGTTSAITENQWTCSTCQTFNWGWSRHAYWLSDTGEVRFQNTGTHTIRVQTREDGVDIDQIVISPVTYVNNAPGPVSNDNTIVAKPGGSTPQAPAAPSGPSPATGASATDTSMTLSWTAAGATRYDVHFGSINPPPLASENQTEATFEVSSLGEGVTYYWRVIAKNDTGSTTGPVWSFTTAGGGSSTLPGLPTSPSPASGASNVSTTPTLSWSSSGAEAYDVHFGTSNPPPSVSTDQTGSTYTPGTLANSTTYYWRIVAHNGEGSTTGPVWSFTTQSAGPAPATDIVIYASDIQASAINGAWSAASDGTSPNGTRLQTTDTGFIAANAPLANPTHYVEATFSAPAGVPYRIWLRLKALGNSKWNDAVWVQFSDARVGSSPIYGIGTTSGLLVNLATDANATSLNNWGWHNGAYWLNQATTVTFATSGTHTIRIQVREDGVMLDQIVLSPSTYLSTPPGPVTNDSTIVPKP
jgi:phosphatidylserine/phosphatidylglycerophosphate/cardiolipin synthase-like enzyme